ncbi:MAG: M20/M25/M40 family metallo-hydrolase [Bacteroidota bacterium]|nr:M20/M25/M40 family metallo-hydrolase [Bacteroidota bacterium]
MKDLLRILSLVAIAAILFSNIQIVEAQVLNKTGQSQQLFKHPAFEKYIPEDAFYISDVNFGPVSGSPEQIAREYLQTNLLRFKMKSNLTDINLAYIQETPAGQHVNFLQSYNGIPIYQSDMVVSIDKTNKVEFFSSNYKSYFTPPATIPQLTEASAINTARTFLGVTGELHGEQKSELMINVENGIGRLVYRIIIPAFEPRGDWEVFVDASNGEVFRVTDMTCFHTDVNQEKITQKKPDFPAIFKALPVLTAKPAIQELVNQVSSTNINNNMLRLEAFKARWASSVAGRDSLAKTRDWLIAQLQSYGYTDIVQQDFVYNGNTLQNIVVTKTGIRVPDTMVVIGGHYDTVNGPGADDNGSGTSSILEVARIIAKRNFEYTIKLIFFSAEEQGYYGSQAYVTNIAVANNHKIRVMINVDMIGYSGGQNIVKVERDEDNSPSGNNAASALFTDTLAALTQLYSTLTTQITAAYASDYIPFENAGYVITGFYEKNENPYYHTVRDSVVHCDINYVSQITKGAVAGVAHFARSTTGSGLVFDPDPLTTAGATYGTGGFVDPSGNDADTPELNGQRVLRTLPDLSFSGGVYRLTGPYINVIDWDPPSIAPVTSAHPDSFRYTRSHDGFEDVMLYYHTDLSQRWIQSLGFTNIQNTSIGADAHGHSGDDNSSYTPSTNRMSFGDGGVDDAEDADVILHEYGHAIQHGSKPGWSGSGQQGALGEGFGDYWAESYSRALNFWQPSQAPYFWVFDWDGHNPFWAGRILNYAPLYPGGLVNQVHTDGQMWSSTLMNIWNDIGREVLDKCVLQSHFYLPTSGATMTLNADAVIQADRNLYGGAHVPSMVHWFGQRGFINPANYVPSIAHTPRGDSENPVGPYPIVATISAGGSALDPDQLKVYWGRTGAFTDSITMTPTGGTNEYVADIPGNGASATYRYYIYAKDLAAGFSTHPVNAPTNFHSFYVGDDITPPVITHTILRNQPKLRWPATVRAAVTDNIGVDTVWVEYTRLRESLGGVFGMVKTTGNNYEGIFDIDTSLVEVGDTIQYKIFAKDKSALANITTHPTSGFHSFVIISTKGIVLVVDDDGTAKTESVLKSGTDDKGDYEVDPLMKGVTGRLILRTLTEAGYIVDTASFAIHDPAQYPNYDIVVWTGGTKGTGVFGDAAKRNALVNRALTGGKIWIEGGEKDYIFRWQTTQVDVDFRRHVLHDSSWLSDVTTSNLVITQPSHAIFNTPNPISGPVAFTGTSVRVRDAMRLIPGDVGAYKVAGWSIYTTQGPDTCAMIIYDNNPNPLSAQIVNQLFAIGSITDTTVAKQLIENTAEYLMTPEPPPSGSLAGVAQLGGTSDWSGVKVKIQGLTVARTDSMITDNDGAYLFSGLYAGNYRITVSKTGFVPAALSRDTTVSTTAVTGFNFTLEPQLPTAVSGTVTLAGQTDHSGVTIAIVGQGLNTTTNAAGYYTITGISAGNITVRASKAGYKVTSKDTTIANGESIIVDLALPVETILVNETFETVAVDGIPEGWTRLDVNGDGNTWKTVADPLYNVTPGGGKGIKYTYHGTNAANDWLITPPIEIEGGVPHRVTFWYRTNSASWIEKIEVMYGTSPTAAALTNLVWRKEDITNITFAKAEAMLLVPTTGTYYVGWRVYSIANQFNPGLDDIKIEVAPVNDIGVSKLWNPVATEFGKAFTQPSDEEIARISEAEISEAKEFGKTAGRGYIPWNQSAPFEEGFQFTKSDSIVLYAEVTNFGQVSQSTYNVQWTIGGVLQTPVAASRSIIAGGKDTMRLVWHTPVAGMHQLAAFTDLVTDEDRANDTARTVINYIPGAILSESFEGSTTIPDGWSTAVVTTGSTVPVWSIITGTGTNPAAPPYSGNRQARFNSYSASTGSQARLTTRRISLPDGGSRMTFWMYHDNGYTTSFDSITVQATTGDSITGPWTRLGNYIRYSATNEWVRDSVDLLAFGGQSKVFVSFLGTSRYGNHMYLDEINIFPYVAVDYVTVTTPNGGEVFLVGTQQPISWNSYGVTTVNLDYTTDNGSSWISIASDLPAKYNSEFIDDREMVISKESNLGSYMWTIPNTPSIQTRVRVTSATNPALTDLSDAVFSIVTTLPTGWTVRASAPDAISRPHAAYVTISGVGHVFVMGGGTPVTTNRKYNTETNSWSSGAALPTASATGGASTVKGLIYSVAGNATGAVQEYNPIANSWTSKAVVSVPYYDFGIVTWNDSLIYVIGGDNGTFTAPTTASNAVRYYNPTTNTWATATSIPVASGKMGAGILGNTIIITGGYDGNAVGLATAYRGDINPANPAQITWTAIANYPAGALSRPSGAGLTNGNGVVFTGGLIGGSTPTANTYLYSLTTNSWTNLPNMITARGNMSSQLANNGIDYMWAACGYSSVALAANERFYLEPISVEPNVRVVSPNGGEIWVSGQQYPISWTHYSATTVKIEYSTNNGSSWITVVEDTPAKTDVETNPKSLIKLNLFSENVYKSVYMWTVPHTYTANARVKVTANNNPLLTDMSDAVFSIVESPPPPPPGWASQISPVTTALQSVKAVNNLVVWAAGSAGRVLQTTNGGTSWTAVTNPSSLDNTNIEALDANTAFVIANGTDDARLYRTVDGGASWSLVYQSTAAGAFFNVIKMFDANNGYMQGDAIGSPLKYVLVKTTNGGTTWTTAADLAPGATTEYGWNNSMYWLNNQRAWFGTNNSRIYYTTNSGANWISGTTSMLESPSIFFKNTTTGLAGINAASNATPTIARSTNGGGAWANITSPITGRAYGMDGTGDKVWVTSATNIIRTTDFGTNWSTQFIGTGTATWYHLSVVKVGNEIHGWSVRSNGEIIKYFEYEAPQVGSIAGMKFNDLNGNGTRDAGEPGLANWKIYIASTTVDSTLTNESGNYSFTNLSPATYTVSEQLQTGWLQTAPVGGTYSLAVSSGLNLVGINFGNFRLGQISGVKFDDMNGNGIWDQGEIPLGGWTINLAGPVSNSVITDQSGYFEFVNLLAGNYTITETAQVGWLRTYPATSHTIPIISGDVIAGRSGYTEVPNFGNFQKLGSICGIKFLDYNGNCIQDDLEPGMQGWTIRIDPGPIFLMTDSSGAYCVSLEPGTYVVSEVLKPGWMQTCPVGGSYTVELSRGQEVRGLIFGNRPEAQFQDLVVSIAGGIARPGFEKWYGIQYRNAGTVNVPGTQVVFTLPAQVQYLSSSGGIHSGDPSGGTVTFNTGDLPAGFVGWLWARVQIPTIPIVNLGDILHASVIINPVSGDITPANNVDSESQVVIGAWDPNDKLVAPEGYFIPSQALTYTVRFQNTGTDTAFNIVIRDTLDANLDISTVVPGGSSHPYTFGIDGNRLSFSFYNIQLPDSNVNEPGSHGFVKFTVEPLASIPPSTCIENRAGIYFDFNPVVLTNSVVNCFKLGTISGTKFNDLNGDGVWNEGEPTLEGWTINLSGPVSGSTVTNSDGRYQFTDLTVGTYTVSEVVQSGWKRTYPADPGTHSVDIFSGSLVENKNFGNFKYGTVSGLKFWDRNNNGVKDLTEVGLENWEIKLNGAGTGTRTTMTNSAGEFSFFDVFADYYTLTETVKPDWIQTAAPTPFAITSGSVVTGKMFGNFLKADSIKYRTFRHEHILALDARGKPVKAVKRKAYQVEQIINLTAPAGDKTDLHVEFQGAVYQIVSIEKNGGPCAYTLTPAVDGKAKKFDIVFDPPPLTAGDIITIHAYVKGSKPLKFKWYWTPLLKGELKYTLQPTDTAFALNMPRLPMPNYINLLEEVYANGGFGTTGMLIGIARTDSPKAYGWLEMPKAKDVYKTLWDSKGGYHDKPPRFFDVFDNNGKPLVKKQKSLPPHKHDNSLLGEIIACKLAVAASELQQIPYGFGYLIYYKPGNAMDGKTIQEIVDSASASMTRNSSTSFPADSFFDIFTEINDAFEGPIDSVSFAPKTVLTGVKYLADVPFLRANSGTPPPPLTQPAGVYVEVPDVFELAQNYPNPFNPTTTIEFILPEDAMVTLKVYNVLGQEVAALINNELYTEGRNDIEFDAGKLSSGVYFYRLTAEGLSENDQRYIQIKKMILMK